MKILKAISTSLENKGKVLGTNKLPKVINGKLTVIFLTKKELCDKIKNSFVESFLIEETII
jgi:hypothetical protein